MTKYYTRACNFFYGPDSRQLVKKKLSLPLCNDSSISFNQIELFSRNKKIVKNKIVDLKNIKKLPKKIKEKVIQDLKKITKLRKMNSNTDVKVILCKDKSNYVFNLETSTQLSSFFGNELLWGRKSSIINLETHLKYWDNLDNFKRITKFIGGDKFTLIASPSK